MERTKPAKSRKKAARKSKPRRRKGIADDFITGSIDASGADAPPGRAAEGRASLGERIREARQLRELTLEDLSSRTGIPVEKNQASGSNVQSQPVKGNGKENSWKNRKLRRFLDINYGQKDKERDRYAEDQQNTENILVHWDDKKQNRTEQTDDEAQIRVSAELPE